MNMGDIHVVYKVASGVGTSRNIVSISLVRERSGRGKGYISISCVLCNWVRSLSFQNLHVIKFHVLQHDVRILLYPPRLSVILSRLYMYSLGYDYFKLLKLGMNHVSFSFLR